MSKGDIVLIPFPFTDLSGNKLRPAIVLYENTSDVTVSFVTTQLQWQEPTDLVINPNPSNGIKKISLIRLSKIATIDKAMIVGKIGVIAPIQINEVDLKLKAIFQLT